MSAAPAMTAAPAGASPTPHHRPYEDIQALITGTLFVALGVVLFGQAGLLTGGTAGLAFLIRYATSEESDACASTAPRSINPGHRRRDHSCVSRHNDRIAFSIRTRGAVLGQDSDRAFQIWRCITERC